LKSSMMCFSWQQRILGMTIFFQTFYDVFLVPG
jgi:hypothetical protein